MPRAIGVLLFLLGSTAVFLPHALARTWFVSSGGTGDAPTISAAIDSTAAGDVILVGPGTYYVPALLLRPGTSLVSESGPTATYLRPGDPFPAGQVAIVELQSGCALTGFNVQGGSLFAVGTAGTGSEVSFNIISSTVDAIASKGRGTIHNNICFGGNSSISLSTFSSDLQIFNNILPDGFYSGNSNCPLLILAYCNLINGPQECFLGFNNFSADPQFCGANNYYLQADSPCAPGNHPGGADCGLIGALPVGCGTVRTQQATWGAVKAMYKH